MQMTLDEYAARFPDRPKPVRKNTRGSGWPGMQNAPRSSPTDEICSTSASRLFARLFASHSPDDTLRTVRGRHMRFDYTAMVSWSPDTGEPSLIFRPEIPIVVHGPKGVGDFLALVDTGSDKTILPEMIARDLGIPMTAGEGPRVTAFGGQAIALSYADVELELVQGDEKLRWFHGSVSLPRAHPEGRLFSAIMAFWTTSPPRLRVNGVLSICKRTRTCPAATVKLGHDWLGVTNYERRTARRDLRGKKKIAEECDYDFKKLLAHYERMQAENPENLVYEVPKTEPEPQRT